MSTTVTTTITARKPTTRGAAARIGFASVNPNNLGTLRKLNVVLFPVKYTDRFYKDVLLPEHEDYCKLVYYNDIPVGTVCARIEPGATEGESKLYIMTMGILAPYRSLSLGTQALQSVIDAALASQKPSNSAGPATKPIPSSSAPPTKAAPGAASPVTKPITSVYLHVQTSNADARRFYERNGFTCVGKVDGYYRKIEPRDAWVLEKNLSETT